MALSLLSEVALDSQLKEKRGEPETKPQLVQIIIHFRKKGGVKNSDPHMNESICAAEQKSNTGLAQSLRQSMRTGGIKDRALQAASSTSENTGGRKRKPPNQVGSAARGEA